MIAGAAIVLGAGRWLDALSLGEETARSLGAETRPLGLRLTLGVGLMVGAATSVAGVVGFVGLVAPASRARPGRLQARRRPGAVDAGRRGPGAGGRYPGAPAADRRYELQLGVFTSLVGAPFLVRIIRRSRAAWLAA